MPGDSCGVGRSIVTLTGQHQAAPVENGKRTPYDWADGRPCSSRMLPGQF